MAFARNWELPTLVVYTAVTCLMAELTGRSLPLVTGTASSSRSHTNTYVRCMFYTGTASTTPSQSQVLAFRITPFGGWLLVGTPFHWTTTDTTTVPQSSS